MRLPTNKKINKRTNAIRTQMLSPQPPQYLRHQVAPIDKQIQRGMCAQKNLRFIIDK
jgi:hypothetical protein